MKKFLALFSLGAAGGSIYIIPYIKYVFYDQQLQSMSINNTESGLLVTVYAIISICLLFPGGAFADKYSAKKLILLSLLGTTVLTIVYAFTMSFTIALMLWVGFGITCAFVFWPALIKSIGMLDKESEQGKMYGIYYALNGILAALINGCALYVCTLAESVERGFFMAVLTVAGGTFISMILVFFFFQEDDLAIKISAEERFKWSDFSRVAKMPATWLLAFSIFVSYSIYSSNTYFNPFLIDVKGVTPTDSGIFTILRTYIFMLFAPIGGFFCDRILKSTGKWYVVSFGAMLLFLVGVLLLPKDINPTLASIYTLFPAAFTMAQYGVAWSIQRELAIPPALMGTAIGICSFISWSPDLFMHTMFGYWLDLFGNKGYDYIFTYLIALSALGVALGLIIYRNSQKKSLV